MREKLIEIITYYADFLDWGRIDCIADTIMEECFATDNNVGGNWIPVTERLPDLELSNAKANDMDLFPCLCFIPHKRAKNGWYITKLWYTGEGFIDGDNVYWDEATHWMPLPEAPKGE